MTEVKEESDRKGEGTISARQVQWPHKIIFCQVGIQVLDYHMSDRSLQAFSYFTSSSLYRIHRTVDIRESQRWVTMGRRLLSACLESSPIDS